MDLPFFRDRISIFEQHVNEDGILVNFHPYTVLRLSQNVCFVRINPLSLIGYEDSRFDIPFS